MNLNTRTGIKIPEQPLITNAGISSVPTDEDAFKC
jgi:hypothetical protein